MVIRAIFHIILTRDMRLTIGTRFTLVLLVFLVGSLYPEIAGAQQERPDIQVTRWDDRVVEGTFQGFSDDGSAVVVVQEGQERTIPLGEALKLDFEDSGIVPDLPSRLEFRGGGTLVCEIMDEGKQGEIPVQAPLLAGTTAVRITWLKRMEFGENVPSGSEQTRDTENNDVLRERNGDRYRGILTRVTPDEVVFEDENLGEKSFSLKTVRTIELAPVGSPVSVPEGPYLEVHGTGGTVLPGTPVSASDGRLVLKGLIEGMRWKLDLKHVRTVFVKNGRATYLSDLDPKEVVQKEVYPWQTDPSKGERLMERFRWRRDRAVPDHPERSEPLTIDGTVYEKGIGCTSYTKLTYQLDGNFSRFRTTIGLDDLSDHPNHEGSAVFRVYADGTEAFVTEVAASDSPRSISVDLTGASSFSIETDLGTGYLDFANWADARLIRNE